MASLAIKIFALYVLIQTIILIANAGSIMLKSTDLVAEPLSWLLSVPFVAIILLIALFLILWRLANDVTRVTKIPSERKEHYQVDQIFILHLLGFFLLTSGLVDVVNKSFSLYYLSASDTYLREQIFVGKALLFFDYLIGAAQIIIGVMLIVQPYGWARALKKIRGQPEQ